AGEELRASFQTYAKARKKVLPYLRTLAVEPLAVAAHPESRKLLLDFLGAYEPLNQTLRNRYEQLFDKVRPDAKEILGHLLLLETIVVRIGELVYAIAAPIHPLYVWHYARYCQIVDAQREQLDERDRELVADAAEKLPLFLTSLFIPATAFGQDM